MSTLDGDRGFQPFLEASIAVLVSKTPPHTPADTLGVTLPVGTRHGHAYASHYPFVIYICIY